MRRRSLELLTFSALMLTAACATFEGTTVDNETANTRNAIGAASNALDDARTGSSEQVSQVNPALGIFDDTYYTRCTSHLPAGNQMIVRHIAPDSDSNREIPNMGTHKCFSENSQNPEHRPTIQEPFKPVGTPTVATVETYFHDTDNKRVDVATHSRIEPDVWIEVRHHQTYPGKGKERTPTYTDLSCGTLELKAGELVTVPTTLITLNLEQTRPHFSFKCNPDGSIQLSTESYKESDDYKIDIGPKSSDKSPKLDEKTKTKRFKPTTTSAIHGPVVDVTLNTATDTFYTKVDNTSTIYEFVFRNWMQRMIEDPKLSHRLQTFIKYLRDEALKELPALPDTDWYYSDEVVCLKMYEIAAREGILNKLIQDPEAASYYPAQMYFTLTDDSTVITTEEDTPNISRPLLGLPYDEVRKLFRGITEKTFNEIFMKLPNGNFYPKDKYLSKNGGETVVTKYRISYSFSGINEKELTKLGKQNNDDLKDLTIALGKFLYKITNQMSETGYNILQASRVEKVAINPGDETDLLLHATCNHLEFPMSDSGTEMVRFKDLGQGSHFTIQVTEPITAFCSTTRTLNISTP